MGCNILKMEMSKTILYVDNERYKFITVRIAEITLGVLFAVSATH